MGTWFRSGTACFVAAGTLTMSTATAQSGPAVTVERPLTLEAAAREAIAWHPTLKRAAGELNARQTEIDAARAGYSPQISAGLATGLDSRLTADWRPRPQINVSQMLYDFGKVSSDVDFARAGTRLGEAEMLLAIDQLARETGYAVTEVQRGEALYAVATDQLERVRAISDLVGNRVRMGAATKSDGLQAQARVEAAVATLSQIEAARRRWSSNLAYLLGRPAPPADVADDAPDWLMSACQQPPPDWDEVPAVMVAEAQRRQAVADLKRRRADQMPTVSIGGTSTIDVSDPFSDRRSAYSLGLNVTSNVFGGGISKARVRGASFALQAADAAIEEARNEAAQRLAEAQQQIESLSALLTTLASRQSNMDETGKLYRLQYLQMGTRTLVDLLNAEQEYQQVRFEAVNSAHDLRRLQLDCLYNSGRMRAALDLTGEVIRGVPL
jgi:outer membrane protein, adhesin transport system